VTAFALIVIGSAAGRPNGFVQSPVASEVDDAHLDLLRWRMVGPSRGGRVMAVAGDPVNELVFYQGTTGGGVWKTDDAGVNWQNVSDGYFRTGSVGAIAVAESNPAIVYVGMGEACIRGNASHGDGVYRSTDAGRTWTRLGLETTRHIARVRVHPANPDLVYVAALGDAWGPSADRGVYRSTDGGRTWDKVLYRNEHAGAIDLVMDATNPSVLYASLLELRRFPWGFRSAGPGTGLFKSTDGGATWMELSDRPGLPAGLKGRIGLAVSPARPTRVWAIIDAELGSKGLFRSDDAGETWERLTDNADLTQRPWYYHHIVADPKDPEVVWVLNVNAWKSTDGGRTFAEVDVPHGDNHDLWIDPRNPMRMVNGNDGGATVSFNGGRSWSTLLNQPTAQLYHVAVDNQVPYRLYGAQQDNTTISLPSRSDKGLITIEDWETVGGGEDGYIAPHPTDFNIVYAADHHWLHRYDRRTRQVRDISPNPETHYGWGSADINYRFWWTYPVMVSPHDPKVIYATSQVVHRSRDEGQSWEIVSPDLSRHDPKTLEQTPSYLNPETQDYWGPITREAYGPEWYATIFAFAESPKQAGVLWAGSDDGYVHVSRDNGANWENVSPPDLPEFALISTIDPSPHDAATAYVAATRYKLQDLRPYLYRTRDFGRTWTQIAGGLPDDDFTRVIREDPGRRGLLYTGTETGVYVSFDDGGRWQSLQRNLPVTPIHDLVVKEGDLVAATHGRSFWILDNVALLHQFDAASLAEPVKLFEPRTTVRYRPGASAAGIFGGGSSADGQNPPAGVVVSFFLKEAPAGPATLTFVRERPGAAPETAMTVTLLPPGATAGAAGQGRSVPTARAGANTYVWNLRYPPATVLPGVVFQGSPAGPVAPPGAYRVTLDVGGRSESQSFRLVGDPRGSYTDAQLEEQFQFLIEVRDRLSETMGVVRRIREMRAGAQELVKKATAGAAGRDARRAAALDKALATLDDGLYPIEERLVQYRARAGQDLIAQPTAIDSKLARLMSFAGSADGPPTQGSRDLFARLSKGVAEHVARLEAVERTEHAALVKLAGR
jgi:photosystem II stability/assembly factor-like uncharacterized protein